MHWSGADAIPLDAGLLKIWRGPMISSLKFGLAVALATGVSLGSVTDAAAAAILSPTTGVIDAGGPGFGTLDETRNQAGLSAGFVSGVTDYDAYLATGPTHTLVFAGNEWFSNSGTTSAQVTYGLGALYSVSGLALWNEESSGIGLLDLSYSTDGVVFIPLLSVRPFDNPLADYPAESFLFGAINASHFRFSMSECPQIDPGSFAACAIGEVAFRVDAVPEPALLGLVSIGLAGALRRKLRNRA